MVKVPPLSAEEKLTIARWIDIGCPIDRDYDAERPSERGRGWLLDEGRPTLALSSPLAGRNREPLSRILIGMHDYSTGIDFESFTVSADFEIDGIAAGENLASKFQSRGDGVWEWKFIQPIANLPQAVLNVSVKDQAGNVTRIERSFEISGK
jgi:hypothetical protein